MQIPFYEPLNKLSLIILKRIFIFRYSKMMTKPPSTEDDSPYDLNELSNYIENNVDNDPVTEK